MERRHQHRQFISAAFGKQARQRQQDQRHHNDASKNVPQASAIPHVTHMPEQERVGANCVRHYNLLTGTADNRCTARQPGTSPNRRPELPQPELQPRAHRCDQENRRTKGGEERQTDDCDLHTLRCLLRQATHFDDLRVQLFLIER